VRLLAESGLTEGKTLSRLDIQLLPTKVRKQLSGLTEGGFVDRSANVLAFARPGRGETSFLAALGRELILRHSRRVLFRPAFKLVGQLPAAKRDRRLEQELKKLDRFDVLILDDIDYVPQSREEMEVLFTLLAERYERRSILISSNLVFSQWDQIFKDPLTTMAAIDRLVHHSIILEFDVVSQPVKKAGVKAKTPPAG
jgi:DNA replication protein DnaC